MRGGAIWAPRGLISGATSERESDFWGREPAARTAEAHESSEVPGNSEIPKFRKNFVDF